MDGVVIVACTTCTRILVRRDEDTVRSPSQDMGIIVPWHESALPADWSVPLPVFQPSKVLVSSVSNHLLYPVGIAKDVVWLFSLEMSPQVTTHMLNIRRVGRTICQSFMFWGGRFRLRYVAADMSAAIVVATAADLQSAVRTKSRLHDF